jgi:hypothetical protein
MPERSNLRRNEDATLAITARLSLRPHEGLEPQAKCSSDPSFAGTMEVAMLRNLAFVIGYAVILILSTTALVCAADFGTERKPKPCLREQWPR